MAVSRKIVTGNNLHYLNLFQITTQEICMHRIVCKMQSDVRA